MGDIETRLNEVGKLLKAVISTPRKVGVRAGGGAGHWVGRWVAGALLEASGAGRGQEPRRGRLPGLWELQCFLPPGRSGSRGSQFTGK